MQLVERAEDWDLLRRAFEDLHANHNIIAVDTPFPGGRFAQHPDRRQLRDRCREEKRVGGVYFFEEDVSRAQRDGNLRISVLATPKPTVGSRLAHLLFSENVQYALSLIELDAVAEIVEDALEAVDLRCETRYKAYQRILVVGQWTV